MNAEDARNLYEYNGWANWRMLSACDALSSEQFTRKIESSFPSIRDTVEHILWVEWLWLERWRGRSPSGPPSTKAAGLSEIREQWQPLEAELLTFVRGLSPSDFERVIEYRNTKGTPYRTPLWQMLQHVVNHGTYHRGQVTTMIRQVGGAPVATDYTAYFREKSGQPLV